MNDSLSSGWWQHNTTTIIASALVLGGFLLTSVSWWFLLLVAAGTLGPGVLREFGWIRDRDEFQRLAAYRAGYHAYLTSGLVAFVLVAFIRSDERTLESSQELSTLFLALLWFTWLLSSLIAYWGIQKAAFRILIGFGSAWLLFAILSNTGSEWTSWTALLLHPLLAAPFFALAWLSGRWPRITGVLLLVVAASLFNFFGYFRRDNLALVNQAIIFVLFIGPLLASGIALVNVKNGSDEFDELTD